VPTASLCQLGEGVPTVVLWSSILCKPKCCDFYLMCWSYRKL